MKSWQKGGGTGMTRFVLRAWRLLDGNDVLIEGDANEEQMRALHRPIRRVSKGT